MAGDSHSTEETREAIKEGAERARETVKDYAKEGGLYASRFVAGLASFVQEEPWLAVAGAFVLGYVAAQLIKRLD